MNNQDTQLDPDAVNLSKAIRQTESGGNFQAKGKSGEYGAYQFTAPTWASSSKKYLGQDVPLEQSTPEQQNEVAYKQIKEWKDKGHNVGQIASMWNAGEKHKDAYLDTEYKGVNDYGASYNVPAYAKSVATAYQTIKNGGQVGVDPSNPSSVDTGGYSTKTQLAPTTDQTKIGGEQTGQSDTLGGQLANRVGEFSKSAGQVAGGLSDITKGNVGQGAQGVTSGALHVLGTGAGMLGDVVNKLIEQVPGVKSVEGYIGKKAGDYAQTEGGQALVKSMQDFNQKNPKLSQGLGDIFNIATAIPILRGLSVVKDVALDSASLALKKVAENTATKDFTATASRTIGGRNAIKAAPDAVKTLVQERAIPEIIDGKYNTKEAFDNLSSKISNIEDTRLQPELAKLSTEQIAQRQPIEELRKKAIADVKQEFKGTGDSLSAEKEINRKFDGFKNEYGDYVTLQDVNDMKRGVRTSVNFNSPKLEGDVSYHLGQTFQKNIEDVASKMGLEDVGKINKEMADLIKAQGMLKHIEGKPVKTGVVGGIIQTGTTAGGAALGTAAGFSPETAAFMGYKGGGAVSKKLGGITEGILKRTEKGSAKENIKKAPKKIFQGMVSNALQQKVNDGQNKIINRK